MAGEAGWVVYVYASPHPSPLPRGEGETLLRCEYFNIPDSIQSYWVLPLFLRAIAGLGVGREEHDQAFKKAIHAVDAGDHGKGPYLERDHVKLDRAKNPEDHRQG